MGCDLTCNMLKTMCSTSTDMLVSKKANKMNWEGVTRPSSTPIVISTTAQLLENLSAVELAGKYDEPVWRRLEVAAAV